ncbi:ParA family protein [Hymenobacter profundi]|uniref:ParA family protein n=1 Tax=Hymenobacter profundi TaxID=1982110 RepID=A0ABS6WZ51_9BACT|nr:ParA family protein [Hymenobacter profundi]
MFTRNVLNNTNTMQILTFTNRKGGTGKSTSAWAVAHCLAHDGHRVLLVDGDPQMNLTQALPASSQDKSLTQILDGSLGFPEAMQQVGTNLWLVPASPSLAAAEKLLGTDAMYPLAFKNLVGDLRKLVDFVIFDTGPSPNSALAMAAITASDQVYIPTTPEYFAFNGLESLLDLVSRIQKNFSPNLRVGGVFLTKYAKNYRKSLHHQFVDVMQQHPNLGAYLMESTIRDNVAVAEAQVNQQSLYEWAPQSAALQDYEALTQEILRKK